MIYRSRYLDRLLFSPLGYRERQEPRTQARPSAPTRGEGARPGAAPPQAAPQSSLGERAAYLSSRELRDIVGRCEQAIMTGRAQIEDYEAFIICQQELSSRG